MRAKKTDFWHGTAEMPQLQRHSKLFLDVNQSFGDATYRVNGLLNYLEITVQSLERKLDAARKHIPTLLELVYEDDIEPNVMIGVQKVLDRFNVPPTYKTMPVPLVKTSHGLQHDLENYDFKAYLHNTPYAWMLEE